MRYLTRAGLVNLYTWRITSWLFMWIDGDYLFTESAAENWS